jgi:hypothetical protein
MARHGIVTLSTQRERIANVQIKPTTVETLNEIIDLETCSLDQFREANKDGIEREELAKIERNPSPGVVGRRPMPDRGCAPMTGLTLEEFKATHEVSRDFERWGNCLPIHESAPTVAIHTYRDREGTYTIMEQLCVSGLRWFEYDWQPGGCSVCATLDDAVAELYQEYAVDAIGAGDE